MALYGEDMSPGLATDLLTRKQAANYLGLSQVTLARWAIKGRGPSYSRSGKLRGRVWYAAADLEAWIQARKISPSCPLRGDCQQ